jgi:hypothetical protein
MPQNKTRTITRTSAGGDPILSSEATGFRDRCFGLEEGSGECVYTFIANVEKQLFLQHCLISRKALWETTANYLKKLLHVRLVDYFATFSVSGL